MLVIAFVCEPNNIESSRASNFVSSSNNKCKFWYRNSTTISDLPSLGNTFSAVVKTNDLNIITNIYYDRITTSAPELSYIITATYSLNERWSTFFENQTISNSYRVESNIGSGLAFLWNPNLQINTSLRLIADGKSKGFYASFGSSYRLNKHQDQFTEVDELGNPIEKNNFKERSKKGFFGRLFAKITAIFNKKGKSSSRPKKLTEKSLESIKKNTNKDEQTINNDTLSNVNSKPIRTKPKRVRVKPTKYKEVKSDKKKGFLGIFKGTSNNKKEKKRKEKEAKKIDKMSQKDIDKELKKLDKKQKKLERELKKEEDRDKRKEAKKKKKEDEKDDESI